VSVETCLIGIVVNGVPRDPVARNVRRSVDFGVEMMLLGRHASGTDKRSEGNARLEIGIIETIENLLADVAVEMMPMLYHVSGPDTSWEGGVCVEMARDRSFKGPLFKTAGTQKATTSLPRNRRSVDRSQNRPSPRAIVKQVRAMNVTEIEQ
jgi:hypothetical protein